MKCSKCGKKAKKNEKFCNNCGAKLDTLKNRPSITLKNIIILVFVILIIIFVASICVYLPNKAKQPIEQNALSSNSMKTNTSNNISTVVYKNIDNFDVPIPNGFYYVGGTVNTGIVISDNKHDLNAGTNTNLLGNQFVWVPCTLEQFIRKDWGRQTELNGSSYKGFSSFYDDEDTEEFKALKESIIKYQGFYIGRYEASCKLNGTKQEQTSLVNVTVQCKKSVYTSTLSPNFKQAYNVRSYKTGALWNGVDYETAEKYSKNMYKNSSSVYSHLPYGVEWDRILQWLIDSNSKSYSEIVEDSSSWGTYMKNDLTYHSGSYTSTPNNTGENINAVSNNIFDLAGNLNEWTQETLINTKVVRGGNYMLEGNGAPACYRSYIGISTSGDTGFRVALFIK